MSLAVVACQCGSSQSLARNFLHSAGYPGWATIPIVQGKERSKRALERIPRFPEIEMLENFLEGASKWVVIIGWNDQACRWSDISHNASVTRVEAQFLVDTFK